MARIAQLNEPPPVHTYGSGKPHTIIIKTTTLERKAGWFLVDGECVGWHVPHGG